ncbi:MAG: NF038122 family metalloprotease [Cyanobacteria bacterium J06643_13]
MSKYGFGEGAQFNFSYAPGTSQQQMIGFEMAGELWSQYLNDDVTINIHVEVTDLLPENVIGGALPGMKKDVKYDKVFKELSQDITSWDDWHAVSNLTGDKEFYASLNGQAVDKLKDMKLTNANLKALDLLDGDKEKLDGYILMSDLSGQSNVNWEYDASRNSRIDNDELDFLSVAVHEVGHVLGFTSGLDDGEWLNVVTEAQQKGEGVKGDKMKFMTPLDLFRYSGNRRNELSLGQDSYFSIDGGRTNLGNFSTGEYQNLGGDGYQASHWQHNGQDVLGIMDPVLKLGVRREISALDRTAMDVTGWDVANPGQLDWRDMYSDAVENAQNAYIGDRDKDVEEMIKDSNNYKGRSSKRGSNYRRQEGFWQNIKFQTLDNVVVEVPATVVLGEVFTLIDNSISHTLPPAFSVQSKDESEIDFGELSPTITAAEAEMLTIEQEKTVVETTSVDLFAMNQLTGQNLEEIASLL